MPSRAQHFGGHHVDGVDAADDAGPVVGALALAHAGGTEVGHHGEVLPDGQTCLVDFLAHDGVGFAQRLKTVAGNGTKAADAQAGTGERLTLDHVLGQTELAAHDADLVLVQQLDGLAKLKLQVLGQATHVVVGLHAILGLQDVGIDGALGEEADLVANLAGLLFGSMGMRRTYANAPSYDLIICRTRCVSHRCDKAFCRGGNFSYCRAQLGFGSHLGSIANRLFLYTFCAIVCHTRKFQSRVTGVQLLLLLPAVGRWKMDCDGYPCVPMPLMCTAFVPGQIDAAVAGISDPDSRAIATAEALYFRGQATLAAKTARPYLDATDPALRYSACFICGYASLSLNRIADARRCLTGILDTPADEESPAVHAVHILFASAASVLLHLPSPYSAEEFYPLAAHLPEGLRLFASYVMAHALYLRGEYGRSLGMVENA